MSGIVKLSVEVVWHDIVTLVSAARLLPILEKFRERNEIQPLLTLTGDALATAINQFDVQVNRECNKYLTEIVPPQEGREALSIHNLRSLWGAIAAYFFCPPTAHEYPFLQHYLGHAIDSAATGHYFRGSVAKKLSHAIGSIPFSEFWRVTYCK